MTPSARSGSLIAGDGMKNSLSRSEPRTVRNPKNNQRINCPPRGEKPLDRKSPIQVSCELVSENAKFPASRVNTGNFIDSGLGGASEAAKKGMKSVSYGPIPYAS